MINRPTTGDQNTTTPQTTNTGVPTKHTTNNNTNTEVYQQNTPQTTTQIQRGTNKSHHKQQHKYRGVTTKHTTNNTNTGVLTKHNHSTNNNNTNTGVPTKHNHPTNDNNNNNTNTGVLTKQHKQHKARGHAPNISAITILVHFTGVLHGYQFILHHITYAHNRFALFRMVLAKMNTLKHLSLTNLLSMTNDRVLWLSQLNTECCCCVLI